MSLCSKSSAHFSHWEGVPRDPRPALSMQSTVQIGNQLPGLKMRTLVIGGVTEDKVSVRHGFRGCMQVWRAWDYIVPGWLRPPSLQLVWLFS